MSSDKTSILRRHSTIVTTTDAAAAGGATGGTGAGTRPFSECYLSSSSEVRTQTLLYTGGGAGGTIPEEPGVGEEEEESADGGRYEIDCSQSDVEVRCLSRRTSSLALPPRIHPVSTMRHSMIHQPRHHQYDDSSGALRLDPAYPRAHYISLKELSYEEEAEAAAYPPVPNLRYPYHHHQPPRWHDALYGTWSQQRHHVVGIPESEWPIRPNHPLPSLPAPQVPEASADRRRQLPYLESPPSSPPEEASDLSADEGGEARGGGNALSASPLSFRPSLSMPSLSPRHHPGCPTSAPSSAAAAASADDVVAASPMRSMSGDDLLLTSSHRIRQVAQEHISRGNHPRQTAGS